MLAGRKQGPGRYLGPIPGSDYRSLADSRVSPVLLGTAVALSSFVSITEVSEYVPTLEQYGERLIAEGTPADSPEYTAKLKAYEQREVMMRKQRLYPEIPPWPVMSFYPMNKIRHPATELVHRAFSRRMELMTEHGKSGMKFAGKVTQLITASTGLDDFEWGVTLCPGRVPEFIKGLSTPCRFDEASARYATLRNSDHFYFSYITLTPEGAQTSAAVARAKAAHSAGRGWANLIFST